MADINILNMEITALNTEMLECLKEVRPVMLAAGWAISLYPNRRAAYQRIVTAIANAESR